MPVSRLRVAVQDVANPDLAIAALPHRETLGKVNAVFDVVDKAHCKFPLFIYRRVLAGMAGFGPACTGVKIPCLSAWRHPRVSQYRRRNGSRNPTPRQGTPELARVATPRPHLWLRLPKPPPLSRNFSALRPHRSHPFLYRAGASHYSSPAAVVRRRTGKPVFTPSLVMDALYR